MVMMLKIKFIGGARAFSVEIVSGVFVVNSV